MQTPFAIEFFKTKSRIINIQIETGNPDSPVNLFQRKSTSTAIDNPDIQNSFPIGFYQSQGAGNSIPGNMITLTQGKVKQLQ